EIKRFADAETIARELRRIAPEGSSRFTEAARMLGEALLGQGRYAEAEPLLREHLAAMEKRSPGAFAVLFSRACLGAAVFGQKRYTDAEPLLLAAYEAMSERQASHSVPERSWPIQATAERLAELYAAQGKNEQAAEWRRKGLDNKSASQP